MDFASAEKLIEGDNGRSLFRVTALIEKRRGSSEPMAFLRGWSQLAQQGYERGQDGIWKFKSANSLIALDETCSQIPFPHDAYALGRIRPDQMPRMLGAITHPEIQTVRALKFTDLTAIQNRVDTQKVRAISADSDYSKPAGVVAHFEGKNFILDGHHRIVGRWLRGDESVDVNYIDLTPLSNALKSLSADAVEYGVCKINEEQRLVYGWASVVEVNGVPVVDHHGDMISPDELRKAAHKFLANGRVAKVMHNGQAVGEVVESMVFTDEIQKALGINLGKVGWMIASKIQNDDAWGKYKTGVYKMFSIGGKAKRVDNDV